MPDEQPATFGPNAWLVDEMYEQFRADPRSVSESWREFFADYKPGPDAPAAPKPAQPAAAAGAPNGAPAPTAAPEKTAETAAAKSPPEKAHTQAAQPLRGAASRVVTNMEASL